MQIPSTLRTSARTLFLAMLLGAAASAASADEKFASAKLTDADGKDVGVAEFHGWPTGVMINLQLTGLTPGAHAVHIHETGSCSPDFSAAGGHFAPEGNGHGFAAENGAHAGDLPNVVVNVEGVAAADIMNTRITLDDGKDALLDDDGAALIVHANADTYGESAGAGDRVACGVIKPGL